MKCNLCESNEFELRYKGNIDLTTKDRFSQYSLYGDLYQCKNCGLVMQKLLHSVDEIISFLKKEA